MYSQDQDRLLMLRRKTGNLIPRPIPARPVPPPARSPRDTWFGRFFPSAVKAETMSGALADDITSIAPRDYSFLSAVPTAPAIAPTVTSSGGGGSSWLDSLFSGIGKVVAPAATALVNIKTQGAVQQAQQQTMAQTWNPALTGPALQAQAYQAAYLSGSGQAPMSGTTLALLGVGALGIILLATRK